MSCEQIFCLWQRGDIKLMFSRIVVSCYVVSLFFHLTFCLSNYYSLWQKPEFTDRKVQSGKEYEYRITAENAGGESGPSEASAPIKASPLRGRLYYNFFIFL